ncbi:MAG TPA: hypothetical protein VFW33_14025 [Gemmataceae bacterium]|nr:hypothetical protein [Gemmataceae bacterium]
MPASPKEPEPPRWWARTAGSLLILLTAAGTVALLVVLARTVLGLWR